MLTLYHDEDTKKKHMAPTATRPGQCLEPCWVRQQVDGIHGFFDLISVDFRHVSVMLRQNPPQLGNSGWTFGGNTTVCQIAVRHFSAFQPEVGQVADQEAT